MKKSLSIVILALVALVSIVALVACETMQSYDMSGVTFTDKTVTYDGTAKTLTVSGKLPDGVAVAYEYFSGETKLESAPVNAGTYKVVAKFTGDEKHKPIDDKTATLTIAKANLEIVLGANFEVTDDNPNKELEEPILFTKHEDGSFSHEYDGKKYKIDVVSSNADVDNLTVRCYTELNDDGSVVESSRTDLYLSSAMGSAIYVQVTMNDDDPNFNSTSVLTSLTVTKRVVEISNAEELQKLRTEIDGVSLDLRKNTKYVLTADVDLNGAVWQTVGTVIASAESADFHGEFDGQGHAIRNFVINELSVAAENANHGGGIALGFFGVLAEASVHDVVFADVTVELTLEKLEERGFTYQWTDNWGGTILNPIYFGLVAGRVQTVGNSVIENVTVDGLDVKIDAYKVYAAAFVGCDKAYVPESDGSTVRKNLVANDVSIFVLQHKSPLDKTPAYVEIGVLAGELNADNGKSIIFEDCHASNVTLISGNDSLTDFNYESWVGGLIGSTRQDHSGLKNCSIENFRIENWTNSTHVGVFCGYDNNGKNPFDVVGCSAKNGDDSQLEESKKYGVFNYTYDSDSQQWTKTAVDWQSTLPQDPQED